MKETEYNREKAVSYALQWALSRNPKYYDFDNLGGDCTNFISQCLYSGSGIMNYAPTYGWYYNSLNDRAPAWTSVEYLYNFLTRKNKTVGPFGMESDKSSVQKGDVIQLQTEQSVFHHTAIINEINSNDIYVCAHTYDSKNRPLSTYLIKNIRFIHISGVRKWE